MNGIIQNAVNDVLSLKDGFQHNGKTYYVQVLNIAGDDPG